MCRRPDANLDCNSAEYNPIRRIPVVVTGDQGCVYIDVVPSFAEADVVLGGQQIVVGSARGSNRRDTSAIVGYSISI